MQRATSASASRAGATRRPTRTGWSACSSPECDFRLWADGANRPGGRDPDVRGRAGGNETLARVVPGRWGRAGRNEIGGRVLMATGDEERGGAARVLRFGDLAVSRWANGLGETREVASDRTADGGLVWRLSIATIAAASDFSALPDVDRRLMNLGDGPLALVIEGEPVTVPRHEVVSFRGEDAVRAQHANGYDLNVMTGRGRARSSLETVRIQGSAVLAGAGPALFAVVALDGAAVVTVGDGVGTLAPLDCLLATPGRDIAVDGHATVALVRIALT
ncbi:HutD family protein [Allobranchiibius sp. CTAmp26]|uniref:HutD/Ves family protein n=1 Tax=Allobranchiibius sp. CTAmp26 TaxID=2815214 RepID=UPI0027DAD62B|nr:HutD family protein [Allobranchiibius sp. CTAmp26]